MNDDQNYPNSTLPQTPPVAGTTDNNMNPQASSATPVTDSGMGTTPAPMATQVDPMAMPATPVSPMAEQIPAQAENSMATPAQGMPVADPTMPTTSVEQAPTATPDPVQPAMPTSNPGMTQGTANMGGVTEDTNGSGMPPATGVV